MGGLPPRYQQKKQSHNVPSAAGYLETTDIGQPYLRTSQHTYTFANGTSGLPVPFTEVMFDYNTLVRGYMNPSKQVKGLNRNDRTGPALVHSPEIHEAFV